MLIEELILDLSESMTLKRLYHTGLFQRISIQDGQEELSSDLKLHRAVLDRAVLDQFHPDKEIKEDVEDWLDMENPDFIDACERADLDPNLVFDLFKSTKKIFKDQTSAFTI